jgi:hypothetical protein
MRKAAQTSGHGEVALNEDDNVPSMLLERRSRSGH